MRKFLLSLMASGFVSLSGCGYHTVGTATHLPASASSIAVPLFVNQTKSYHTETVMTEAVIRELATRTRLRVEPREDNNADLQLKGVILKETIVPYTYNSTTQQSSSFLITVVASVTVTDRGGKVVYENKNYTYRQQYQSTSNLPTFLQENPAAIERLAREFSHGLVADLLESF